MRKLEESESLKEMPVDTKLQYEMITIKKKSSVLSLEEQALCFIDFLNSDDFINDPNLKQFYVELVSLYYAAVFHGLGYKPSKRYCISESYVRELEIRKPEGRNRLDDYKEISILKTEAFKALEHISFDYYTSFPEHQNDVDLTIYRSLRSDMSDMLGDICGTIKFNRFFSEYANQLASVSDQLYRDFIIHWGSNHCVDLIRAIQWKLKDDFRWHNSI